MSARATTRARRGSRKGVSGRAGLRAAGTAALLLVACAASDPLRAQVLSGSWRTLDGGGGGSSTGLFLVRGTIGQPDAGVPLLVGPYRLQGGFWPGAISLPSNMIFSDGFASGNTTAWSATHPLAGAQDHSVAVASRREEGSE